MKLAQAAGYLLFVLLVFLCVVLHEYGHALTARKFGVKTEDIILSPIGGVARLRSMPEKPKHEFLIAIAGPMVNLVIATFLGIILFLSTQHILPQISDFTFNNPLEFVRYIVWINLGLFLFNLIPAFPMDGGRILRSLLAVKLGKLKATKIASMVGRIFAIGFIIFGVFNQQLTLSLIGLYIFMMAGMEYDQTKVSTIVNTATVGQIMRTSFTRLHLSDTYETVLQKYYREGEQNFLVFDSMGNVSGTIPELYIKDTIKTNTQDKSVNQMMSTKMADVQPTDKLKDVIDLMRESGIAIVSVTQDNQLVGVLDRNNIENFIRLKSE